MNEIVRETSFIISLPAGFMTISHSSYHSLQVFTTISHSLPHSLQEIVTTISHLSSHSLQVFPTISHCMISSPAGFSHYLSLRDITSLPAGSDYL